MESIPMTYSMDSSSVDVPYPLNLHPPQAAPQSRQSQSLPPAYDLHRSEAGAAPGGGPGGAASASRQSYASRTTEDSLDGEDDESTEFSPVSQSPSRRRTAAPRWSDAIVVGGEDGEDGGVGADPLRSTTPSGRRKGDDGYHGGGEDAKTTSTVTGTEDATSVIRRGYVDLLRLLSTPELFRDALDWQAKLDSGIDPAAAAAEEDELDVDGLADGTTRFEEEEEEDDSTFRGLQDSAADGDEGDEDGAGGGGGGGGGGGDDDGGSRRRGKDLV